MFKPKRILALLQYLLRPHRQRSFVVAASLVFLLMLLPLFSFTRASHVGTDARTYAGVSSRAGVSPRAAVSLGSLFAPATASAASADNLNFQARLQSAGGSIVPDGYYNIEFKLYSASSGGSALWTETYAYNSGSGTCNGPLGVNDCRVRVVNGYVSVYLGSLTSFPGTIPWDQQLYVTMNVDQNGTTSSGAITYDGEMTPRLKLTAVPYAMRANSANQLQTTSGANTATLSILAPTSGNQIFQIQDQGAAGTYNILTAPNGTDGYIKLQTNTPGTQQTGNFNINGTGIADILQGATKVLTPTIDTATAVALNIGTTNATSINLNQNTTLAAGKSITVTGGNTASRPASPTEGMVYYDTDTKQLLAYANGKWQADRSTATKIVAASNSSQAAKDGADYVADGEAVVGTSTIDGDQVQINAAIAALPASGGSIYLTEGTYRLDGSIVIPSNVKLSGAGDATIVSVNNTFGAALTMVTNSDTTNGNTNITIRDIMFDGNHTNNNTAISAISFTRVGTGTGVTAIPGANITNNTFDDLQGDAISFSTSNNNRIMNNIISNVASEGIQVVTGVNNIVSNNALTNVDRAIAFSAVTYSTISSNSIDASGSANGAIDLASASQHNVIIANTLKNNTNISLRIATSSNNTVTGNIFADNGSTGAISALAVQGNSNDNVISGNTFRDTAGTGYAIDIDNAAADRTVLGGNSLYGTGATTINDLGTGTIYGGQSNGTAYLIQPTTNITIGSATTTTTIQGTLSITPQTSTSTTLLCSNGGVVSTCDASVLAPTATNFIQNQSAAAQSTANYWISGTGRADTNFVAPLFQSSDGNIANALTIRSGNNSAGTAGSVSIDTGTSTSGSSAVNIGATNASTITIGRSGATTTIQGNLVAGQTRLNSYGTGSYSDAQLYINTNGSTNRGIVLQMTSGQSVNALQVVDSNGTILSGFSGSGRAYYASSTGPIGSAVLSATTGSATGVGLLIQGVTSQSGDLMQLRDVSQTNIVSVSANGTLNLGNVTTLVSGSTSVAGQLVFGDGTATTSVAPKTGLLKLQGALSSNQTYLLPTVGGTLLTAESAATGYIQNQNSAQQATSNFWISGTGRADTSITTPLIDTATAVALNIGTTNATSINLNQNTTLAAGKTITLTGGNTASRPASPTEGMVYFDTTTKQLLVYSNGKWQSDRSTSTKIVAASNASQALKDSADYIATGTGDQTIINSALTAAAGGKVYLTEGTYSINDVIFVPANTTLAGAGYGTLVQMATLATNTALNLIESDGYVTIQDIRMDGNASTQSGTGEQNGYYSWAKDHVTFRNNWITNFKNNGIIMNGAGSYTTITGNTTSGNLWGIYLTGSHDVVSNNISDGDGHAITVAYGASHTAVTGNTVHGSTENNGAIDLYQASDITISGNTIDGQNVLSWGAGILVGESTRVTVTGNHVSNGNVAGIMVSDSSGNVVSSNVLYNNGGATDNEGIVIRADSDSNTVTSNTISDTSATNSNYAVDIDSANADTNYLADNTLGGGSINDAGTGTIYGGQVNSSSNYVIQPTAAIALQSSDITTNQTTVNLLNTTATTVNAFGAATTLTMGASGSTTNLQSSNIYLGYSGATTLIGSGTAGMTIKTANATTATGTLGIWTGDSSTGASGSIGIDVGTAATTAGSIVIGSANAESVHIGRTGKTTTIYGTTVVSPQTSTSTTLLCSNSGAISTCDASVVAPTATNFIQNQASTPGTAQSANFNINGTGIANTFQATSFVGTSLDSATSGGTLNLGTAYATAINLGTTTASLVTIGHVNGRVVANSGVVIQGNNTYGSSKLSIEGELQSTATNYNFGFSNAVTFNPQGGSLTNAYGFVNNPSVTGNYNIGTFAGGVFFVNTAAGYTGQVGNAYGILVGSPNISGTQLVPNYYGILVNSSGQNGGNTSGTINNRQLDIATNTAAAGSGGTLNNTGVRINLASGSGDGTTNNYGLFLTGNGGSGGAGTTTNWALYNNSTASNYIAGNVGIGTSVATYKLNVSGTMNQTGNTTINTTGAGTTTIGSAAAGAVSITSNAASNFTTNTGALTLQGAGGVTVATAAGTTSSAVTISTGNASAGASGNISIDTGTFTSGTPTVSIGTANAAAVTIGKTTTTTTVQGSLTTGAAAGTGTFTNNGSTKNTTLALGDLAAGAIGTAAATVNVYTSFTIAPTASGRTYTVPAPTDGAAGRTIYVSNIHASSTFVIGSTTFNAHSTATLVYDGTSWNFAGMDGGSNNYIQNQSSADQAAAFRISGAGTLGGLLTANAGVTVVGTTSINGSGTANTSIGVGSTGTVTIGNGSTGAIAIQSGTSIGLTAPTTITGATSINTTGSGTTTIGSTAGGAVSITANAASNFTTNTGALTLQGAGGVSVLTANAATSSAITIQTGNSTAGTAAAVTIDTGTSSLATKGTINIGTANAGTINIGLATAAANIISNTTTLGTNGGTIVLQGVSGATGNALSIKGGAATTANNNGGSLVLSGGTGAGTGVMGLVTLSPTAFTSSTTVTLSGTAALNTLLTNAVNIYSTVPVNATATGYTLTVDLPTVTTVGRVLYIAAVNGSSDFTLALAGTSVNISMKANSTATLIYNGTGWTAAGASSSTDLQAAYNNTLTSAGGAELVLNAPGGAADGLTIRNNGTPITGALFEVQSSIATNLFSVNNNTTEYAVNGGAENTTLTGWSNYNSGVAAKSTTAGTFATGLAGVSVTTSGLNQGTKNTLSTTLSAGTYVVSFAAKVASGTNTFNAWFSSNGTAQTATCDSSLLGSGYSIVQNFSVTTSWTKVSCFVTVPAGATSSNAILIVNQTNAAFYIDNLSVISNAAGTTPANVQIGGGATGGQPTLFTLDQFAGPPMTANNAAYYGSMYFDTTKGAIQCYQSTGWGACGSAPDDIVSMTPEYTGAVLNGTGVGTMTADFCANSASLSVGSLCASGEARNFYKWTSPQPTSQSYGIYVTYRLPSTFKSFQSGTMSLTGLVDSTSNAGVKYSVFRKSQTGGITQCSADTSALGSANAWTSIAPTTDITASTCAAGGANAFVAGDTLIIRITVNAQSNYSAYVENLTFQYSNK